MIGRGKYKHVYLYEVTEQDLLLKNSMGPAYCLGNVLMFADRHNVDFGNEFARADDLQAAKEYLDAGGGLPAADGRQTAAAPDERGGGQGLDAAGAGRREAGADATAGAGAGADAAAVAVGAAAGAGAAGPQDDGSLQPVGGAEPSSIPGSESIASLTQRIEQRDELLRDLSESLKAQREDNQLLHAQLELTRKQLAVGELKHSELVDDLENVSKETHSISSTLERVMEEKFQLESELAEKITELVEAHLQNQDLRRQLEAPPLSTPRTQPAQPVRAAQSPDIMQTTQPGQAAQPTMAAGDTIQPQPAPGAEATVLTMSSGKQIHILHEFPQQAGPSRPGGAGRILMAAVRVAAILVSLAVIVCVAGIVTTASLNNVSYGEALDMLIGGLTAMITAT
jgi:hypothetical protein